MQYCSPSLSVLTPSKKAVSVGAHNCVVSSVRRRAVALGSRAAQISARRSHRASRLLCSGVSNRQHDRSVKVGISSAVGFVLNRP